MSHSLIRSSIAAMMAPVLATTFTFAAVAPAAAHTKTNESSERLYESPLSSDENGDPTTSSKIFGLLGLTALSWGAIPLIWGYLHNNNQAAGGAMSALPLLGMLAIAPPAMASSMVEDGSSN
ncbi:hypothetical protein [Corynebacterium cystitidis]|uniref:hypothetical protein n=1 Tax=Corynebacterium cystitidis TaxID=35757 RepID=UPI00211E9BDF|nr:hypothetical protein [Corynebacterium cystitidis]